MSVLIEPAENLSREARALLIAIAQGESDPVAAKEGISPYDILVGGGSMADMPDRDGYYGFPEWAGRQFPTGISHAAGRYQFQPGTWRGVVEGMFPSGSSPDFRNPGDQDWAGWLLAQHDYRSRTSASLLGKLRAGDLEGIGSTLQPTWTSMSDRTFPTRYAAALAALPPDAVPAPKPQPAPVQPPASAAPPVPAASPAPVPAVRAAPGVMVATSAGATTALAVAIQYFGSWPMHAPNDTQATALAGLIIVAIGGIQHLWQSKSRRKAP